MPKRRHESSGEEEQYCDNYEERPDYYQEYYDNDEDDSDGSDDGDEDNIEIVKAKRRNVRTGDEDTDEDDNEDKDEEYDGNSEDHLDAAGRVATRVDRDDTRPRPRGTVETRIPTTPKSPELEKTDELESYKQLLRIVRPEETVQKSIQRLGSMIPRRRVGGRNRNQSGSQHYGMDVDERAVDIHEAKIKLSKIIDLAHKLFSDGDLNIYTKTFEDLEEAIN